MSAAMKSSTSVRAATLATASGSDEAVGPMIVRFLDAVWMERGLSPNTLAAYRADLTALSRWLAQRGTALDAHDAQRPARLHRLARGDGRAPALDGAPALELPPLLPLPRARGPASRKIRPRRSRCRRSGAPCRSSLTEEQVESLLGAPADERPARPPRSHDARGALRDRAARLRARQPAPRQVNLNQGVLRIVGKGNRERLIPLGEEAVRWLNEFMRGARGEILLDRQTDHLFPTRRGDRMTRQAFWHIIKRYAKKGGVEQGPVAAHAAPRLRDPPAEPRRRPARRADAARPQRPVDDADLHARGARAHERAARAAPSARLIDSRPGPEPRPRPEVEAGSIRVERSAC